MYYITVPSVLVQLYERRIILIMIDYRSNLPIYDQIVNGFIRLRSIGVLKADDKLPSVRQLANELHINPNTVQKAYSILEGDGIIYSVSGKGSFISGDSAADEALRLAAESDFKRAVGEAMRRGLGADALIDIINRLCEEEEK